MKKEIVRTMSFPLYLIAAASTAGTAFSQDTIQVEASVTIGVTDGEDPYVLGYITGVAGDVEGNIYVSDMQLSRVQVYDSTGRFVETVGRLGRGPGEMQRPAAVAILGEGLWAVSDLGLDAYQWFGSDNAPLARHRRPGARVFEPIQGDGVRGLLDARRSRSRSDSAFYVQRIHLDEDLEMLVDSVLIDAIPETFVPLTDPNSGFNGGAVRIPFAPLTVWMGVEDAIIFSTDGSYVLERALFAGGRDTLVGPREVKIPPMIPGWVSQQALETPVPRLRALAQQVGIRAERWLEQLEIPNRFPSVIRLISDPFGRIWVLSADSFGHPKFDVWTPTGSYRGTIILDTDQWPAIEVMAVSRTHVLGRFELENGVHQIRGFRIPPMLRTCSDPRC